jgi:uridine kinase
VHVQPVLDLIAAVETRRGFTLVGVGGRGGAGKSTLAGLIPGAQVVGTDEFWDGSDFELSRLRREVVDALLEGTVARFHGFDWDAGSEAPQLREVRPEGVVVIEGVCALHRMFREDYDVRVWVEAPQGLRLERGVARDGEEARERWETRWMPSEERYIARDNPIPSAHVIVDGSGGAALGA